MFQLRWLTLYTMFAGGIEKILKIIVSNYYSMSVKPILSHGVPKETLDMKVKPLASL